MPCPPPARPAPSPRRPAARRAGRIARRTRPLALLLPLLLAACAAPLEPARPLDAPAQLAAWQALDPADPALREALVAQGHAPAAWPLPAWDRPALLALALARSPQLAAARARLQAARDAARAAAAPPRPGLGLALEQHSEDGEASRSPWSLALALDGLPLGRSGQARRLAEAERAAALAEAAGLDLAESAWALRQTVHQRHAELQQAQAAEALAARHLALARQREALLLRQRDHGALDAQPPRAAAQLRAEAEQAQATAAAARRQAGLALAQALSLPPQRLAELPLAPAEPPGPAAAGGGLGAADADASRPLQTLALQHRLPLRACLARHAAAEAALRVELARQWPELHWSPGLAWDQGDRIWRLGLALNLPPAGGNRAAIAQAAAALTAQAADCLAVQTEALALLHQRRAALDAAQAAAAAAAVRHEQATAHRDRVAARLARGDTDRLDLLAADQALLDRGAEALAADTARDRAHAALEDALQHPLAPAAPPPTPRP